VALLFATYMVKPSPFCLLDEIDAALDEANVVRFVHMIREFGDKSQFIVITHNKKTVTAAKTLLGVTMEESGVTKVIAVKLENDDGKMSDEERGAEKALEAGDELADEDVDPEEGRELPPDIDDPAKVSVTELHPILAQPTLPSTAPVLSPSGEEVPVVSAAEAFSTGGNEPVENL
jgi:chromosome segregation protein